MKRIRHVFGYFSSTPQKYINKVIIYLTLIVEVNSLKIKWIMGVCDLNYWLVCAEYMSLICHIWIQNKNVSLFQPPRKLHIEDKVVRWKRIVFFYDQTRSCHLWTGSVRSSRKNKWCGIILIILCFISFTYLIVCKWIHFLCIDLIYYTIGVKQGI